MTESAPPLWPDARLDDLLALAANKYDLEFEPVSAAGVELQILQIANMRELLDAAIAENALADAVNTLPLWAKIWPASLVLGHVLGGMPHAGRNFLEIGAGCGVTGLVAATLGFDRVCITDVNEDALLFARINILKNGLEAKAEVRKVDIRSDSPGERFSLIAGSEILYLDHLYRPLVKFLKRHLAAPRPGSPAEALLATDHRRAAKPFFKRADKEFQISQKRIGVRETSAAPSGEAPSGDVPSGERHLFTISRLALPSSHL